MNDEDFIVKTRLEGILSYPGETLHEFRKRYSLLCEQDPAFEQYLINNKMISYIYENDHLKVRKISFVKNCSKGLFFWEGGATWDLEYQQRVISLIQIKNQKKEVKKEILDHEIIHDLRSLYKEPLFEEFIAYFQSKYFFRRFFGPIFKSSKEVFLIFIFYFLGLLAFIFFEYDYLLMIPFPFLLMFLMRLFFRQKIFHACVKNVSSFFKLDNPLLIIISLTDKEIIFFSKATCEMIKEYVDLQKCPRWMQIQSLLKLDSI